MAARRLHATPFAEFPIYITPCFYSRPCNKGNGKWRFFYIIVYLLLLLSYLCSCERVYEVVGKWALLSFLFSMFEVMNENFQQQRKWSKISYSFLIYCTCVNILRFGQNHTLTTVIILKAPSFSPLR